MHSMDLTVNTVQGFLVFSLYFPRYYLYLYLHGLVMDLWGKREINELQNDFKEIKVFNLHAPIATCIRKQCALK